MYTCKMGQIMDNNVRKDQNPNCCFQKTRKQKQCFGSKNWILHIHPTLSTTKGQAIYANTSASFFDTPLSSCHIRNQIILPTSGSRQSKHLFSLTPDAAGAPIKSYLNFLYVLLSIVSIQENKSPKW